MGDASLDKRHSAKKAREALSLVVRIFQHALQDVRPDSNAQNRHLDIAAAFKIWLVHGLLQLQRVEQQA
jgi:hypothetical protein